MAQLVAGQHRKTLDPSLLIRQGVYRRVRAKAY